MTEIIMGPIGIIHSPYKENADILVQGFFKRDVKAWIELKTKYQKGLKDLAGFSHAIILYYFHKSNREDIRCGWVEKHFKNGNVPDSLILRRRKGL